jgi:hypothetical protein
VSLSTTGSMAAVGIPGGSATTTTTTTASTTRRGLSDIVNGTSSKNSNGDGIVRVFQMSSSSSGKWEQLGLDIVFPYSLSTTTTPAQFGASLELNNANGTMLAIGAPGYNNHTGIVLVFSYNSTVKAWKLFNMDSIEAALVGEQVGERFGTSVAIAAGRLDGGEKVGVVVAVGAPGFKKSLNNTVDHVVGRAAVFYTDLFPADDSSSSLLSWQRLGKDLIRDGIMMANAQCGCDVSLSTFDANIVAVGCPGANSIFVYTRVDNDD